MLEVCSTGRRRSKRAWFEWDVKRLVASIVVAAGGNGHRRDHTFDRALESVAFAYADQNDADYTAFSRAADDDRIAVQRGVGSGERTLWRRTAR